MTSWTGGEAQASRSRSPAGDLRSSSQLVDFSPGGVLLVEDDRDTVSELGEVLAEEGLRVVTASNGREALEALRRWRPSVIVLDLMMPIMTGWEFLDAKRSDARISQIPLVIITAAFNAYRVRDLAPVFIKPLNLDSLFRAIRQHTNGAP